MIPDGDSAVRGYRGRPMDHLARARRVFEIEIAELNRLKDGLGGEFRDAVELLRNRNLQGGKSILVGVGKCSHIAEKIAATLTSTGSPAVALHSQNALHGDLGIVRDGDVVIALSFSGETEELLHLLNALKRFDVKLIAITGKPGSSLGRLADVVLHICVEKEACPLELAPTSSTTAMLVLGDALAMVLLEAAGFQPEDFAKFHPAGALGRRVLWRARELMRSRESVPVVDRSRLIPDVLEEMTRLRAGAAMIVNGEGVLAGIFTHGDFVRAFRTHGAAVGEKRVEELMTAGPITIGADRLAVEVLSVLKKHRIDDLAVVDSEGKPVGLVDVQDLSRLGLW